MPETRQSEICRRIAQVRLEVAGPRGKAAFAKRLDLSPSTYDYYESSRVPPADVLVRIAETAGADLLWLLTGQTTGQTVPAGNPILQRAARLLSNQPAAAAPLAAFVEILAESFKFPAKVLAEQSAAPTAGMAVPSAAEPAAGPEAAVGPGLAEPKPVQRAAILARGLDPAVPIAHVPPPVAAPPDAAQRADWIPVLGRSAAGVPHFWSNPRDESGLTMLADLIDRHARLSPSQIRPAAVEGGDEPAGGTVEIITLRGGGDEEVVEFIRAPALKRRHADAFALRIDGESMSPDIRHGDLVVLSPSAPAADGRAAVVQLARQIGVTCKLYRREGQTVHLVPVNEQFAPQSFPARQVTWALRVLARVRGK